MINKLVLSFITFFIITSYSCYSENILINEFMSSNATTIKDEDGEYSDWIELYNNSENEIDLYKYGISDDKDEPGKWIFPNIVMTPHSFLLVFASGKDRKNPQHLHTNFKISSGGESLYLTDTNGSLIDIINSVSMSTDVSFGRLPDGSSNLTTFIHPSPGTSNNSEVNSTVKFSHKSGYYINAFDLLITSSDSIFYTLNGSVPTNKSKLYKTLIHIEDKTNLPNSLSTIKTGYNEYAPPVQNVFKATVIRAVAYKHEKPSSEVFTNTYIVNPNINSKYSNPIISLVTDSMNLFGSDSGIYVPGKSFNPNYPKGSGNYLYDGPLWERDVHIELFEKDGSLGFSQNAGISLQGVSARKFNQKSLRLSAREEYGNKFFNYKVFPQSEIKQYKRILLRSAMCDWSKTIFKDEMGQDLVRNLDIDIQNGRPVIVLVNGEYWGIHMMTEKLDKYYISSKYNLPEDSLNLLENSDAEVIEGSNIDYLAMIDYLKTHDITVKGNYEYMKNKMDIDNFIDYQIAEIFMNNYDWPDNNIKYWKSKRSGSKWRWMLYDLDYSFGQFGADHDMLDQATAAGGTKWPNSDKSTFLLRTLLLNNDFKNQFISRFDALLNSVFTTENVSKQILKYKDMLINDVPEQVNRWHYPPSLQLWKSFIDNKLLDFSKERPDSMRYFLREKFNLNPTANVTIHISEMNTGNITVNGVPCAFVNKIYTGKFFQGLPIILRATPAQGCKFVNWVGIQGGDSVVIYPDKDMDITAVFKKETAITGLYINEFCASNSNTKADEFNEYDDWIELYNNSNERIDLGGLYITDNLKEKCKWQIPLTDKVTTTIEPKEFKIIWADEQTTQEPLHVNIKLSAGGEQIGLFQVIGTDTLVVDSLSFGNQTQDKTFGRYPDGANNLMLLTKPTPGTSNFYDAVNNFYSSSYIKISPNPVNSFLFISYNLTENSLLNISIYNIQGSLIKNVCNKFTNKGQQTLIWDLNDNNNCRVAEGVYFVRFFDEKINLIKKIIIVK